jgi:hypothetical protein
VHEGNLTGQGRSTPGTFHPQWGVQVLSMRKILWMGVGLVAVLACGAGAAWWQATAENNRLGPPVARQYAASVRISGFAPHDQHLAHTGSAVILLGPSTSVLRPASVTGPKMRLRPPDPPSVRGVSEDYVLEGTVGGGDEIECDISIGRYRPGTPVCECYYLSADQERQAKSGALQVLILEVHCGGK